MSQFAKEVRREHSMYTEVSDVNFFRRKLHISATNNEEDVVVLSCDEDEHVYDQESGGDLDESFFMYMAVLEEFGVTIPFTDFEMGVLKLLNVVPSHVRRNSWAFI